MVIIFFFLLSFWSLSYGMKGTICSAAAAGEHSATSEQHLVLHNTIKTVFKTLPQTPTISAASTAEIDQKLKAEIDQKLVSVEVLLTQGVNFAERDAHGDTILHFCARQIKDAQSFQNWSKFMQADYILIRLLQMICLTQLPTKEQCASSDTYERLCAERLEKIILMVKQKNNPDGQTISQLLCRSQVCKANGHAAVKEQARSHVFRDRRGFPLPKEYQSLHMPIVSVQKDSLLCSAHQFTIQGIKKLFNALRQEKEANVGN